MQWTLRALVSGLAPAVLLLALAGCSSVSLKNDQQASSGAGAPAATVDRVAIYVAQSQAGDNMVSLQVPGGMLYMPRVPLLTRADISEAAAMADGQGQNFVGLRFTEAGARKLSDASTANIDRMLAVVIGRDLVAAPRVTEPLNRGVLAFGVPTRQAALDIAARIRGDQQ